MCANSKLSQQKGSPQILVPNFVPSTKPDGVALMSTVSYGSPRIYW